MIDAYRQYQLDLASNKYQLTSTRKPLPSFKDETPDDRNFYVIEKQVRAIGYNKEGGTESLLMKKREALEKKNMWTARMNEAVNPNVIAETKQAKANSKNLEMLLSKYGSLKDQEQIERQIKEIDRSLGKHDPATLLNVTQSKGHALYFARKGYYAPSPYDDIDNLLTSIMAHQEKGEYDYTDLKLKPANFMLKHQDYFSHKSFLVDDLANMTLQEQTYLTNQQHREEVKKRLEQTGL